jgi:hypothetical protein
MDCSYSIRMTRGIYVVSSEDAERVLHAVESGEPHVLVDADTFGDGLSHVPVRIVTAHVMSVAKNLPATDQAEGEGTRASLRLIRGA